jgi:hypothetical protein
MSFYTVHEPPLRAVDTTPDPERFIFIRDGFSFWAFLFSALWMLWYRLWLVLLLYLVVAAGMEAILRYTDASRLLHTIAFLLLGFLVGIEAATLRRFRLSRRGWRQVGVVSGGNLESAEQRFFDAWVRTVPGRRPPPPVPPAPSSGPQSPPPPSNPQTPEVIGLFPKPGASG